MAAITMEKVAQVQEIVRDLEGQGRREDAQALQEVLKRALATSIVHDKGILGSEPVIEGTRTPVRAVIEYLRLYGSKEGVLEALPHLTADQLGICTQKVGLGSTVIKLTSSGKCEMIRAIEKRRTKWVSGTHRSSNSKWSWSC